MKNYYDVLGVTPTATLEEIKVAYREKAKQYHPDRVSHLGPEFRELAERRMKELNEAYEVLAIQVGDTQNHRYKQSTSEQDEKTTESKSASRKPSEYGTADGTSEGVKSSKYKMQVKLKYFYLIMLLANISVATFTLGMEGYFSYNLFINTIPHIIGYAVGFLAFPAIIVGIVSLVSRMRKGRLSSNAHMGIFLAVWLTGVLLIIFVALCEKYENEYLSQPNSTSSIADSLFTVEGCEYSVIFPGKPTYTNCFYPGFGDYIQAEYIAYIADGELVSFFLRAECIVVGDIRAAEINTKEFLQKYIVAYATSNGFQNCGYDYGEDSFGKHAHFRGFKTLMLEL